MYIDLVTINLCPGQGGGGVKPSGTLDIVENGVYNVYSYSSASVDVHPSISLSETYISNGSYNITGEFNGGVITVDVPAPQFVTETLNVSANGTYNPGEGIDGYSQVVVDVPQSVIGITQKEITEGVQIVNLSNSASYVHPYVFEEDTYLQTVNLPNCTSVGEAAFAYCSNLKTVSLPECQTIDSYAFSYCKSLSNISLPNVKSISMSAFTNCRSLSNISLPNVEYIDSGTFNDTAITEAIYPECYVVGGEAFTNCSSLQRVSLPNLFKFGNPWGGVFRNDISLEELTLNMNNYLDFASNYTSFGLDNTKLASGIGSIYVQSWQYDKYITANGWSSLSERFVSVPISSTLSFSNGLLSGYTNIIEYSFNSYIGIGYSEVIDVSLPNVYSVIPRPGTYPPQYAFNNECKNLQTLYLGSMSLCPASFMDHHSNIRSVNLPVCTSIGKKAFFSCSNLTTANLPNVEYVSDDAFHNCSSLSRINIPLCKYIGDYAFQGCSSLSEISLPNVEYIDLNAFCYCPALKSINLPKCSALIGNVFWGGGLNTLILGYSSVVHINYNFESTGITSSTGSIYVPTSLVDAYKSAPIWSQYSNRIFPIE